MFQLQNGSARIEALGKPAEVVKTVDIPDTDLEIDYSSSCQACEQAPNYAAFVCTASNRRTAASRGCRQVV
jgi:hypothetical protein